MREFFSRFSSFVAHWVGSSWAFIGALIAILIWASTGPIFHFSDTWQLIINTATTIVTFLMVFLIQNTQNRDARAMHLKLDELIRSVKGARTGLVDLEGLTDKELDELKKQFEAMRESHTHSVKKLEEIKDVVEEAQDKSNARKRK